MAIILSLDQQKFCLFGPSFFSLVLIENLISIFHLVVSMPFWNSMLRKKQTNLRVICVLAVLVRASDGSGKNALNIMWGCVYISSVKKMQKLSTRIKSSRSDMTDVFMENARLRSTAWKRAGQHPTISALVHLFFPPLRYGWVTTLQCSSVCKEEVATHC